jgi:hypothetical protein
MVYARSSPEASWQPNPQHLAVPPHDPLRFGLLTITE